MGHDAAQKTLIGVKLAFIDFLAPRERWRQIDGMVDRLKADLGASRGATGLALHFDATRIEGEIRWLGALRDLTAGHIGHPAGETSDAA